MRVAAFQCFPVQEFIYEAFRSELNACSVQVIFALPPEGAVDYTMRIYNSDGSEPEMCGNGIRCLARFVAEKDNAGPVTQRIHTLAGALSSPTPLIIKGRSRRFGEHIYHLGVLYCCDIIEELMTRVFDCCAGLIQPTLQEDGQVCVDMGEPILAGPQIPTNLAPTQVYPSTMPSRSVLDTYGLVVQDAENHVNSPAALVSQNEAVVQAPLAVDGQEWLMTCVSMGNPHAVTFGTAAGESIKVSS